MSRLSNIIQTPRQLILKKTFGQSIIEGVKCVDIFTDGFFDEYIIEYHRNPEVLKAADFLDAVASEIIFLTLKNEKR